MDEAGTSGKAALTVLLCFVGALCEGFDVQAAGVAAGGLSREFRPTTQELGIFFSASGAGLIIGAIVGGRGADRLGRKPVLVPAVQGVEAAGPEAWGADSASREPLRWKVEVRELGWVWILTR